MSFLDTGSSSAVDIAGAAQRGLSAEGFSLLADFELARLELIAKLNQDSHERKLEATASAVRLFVAEMLPALTAALSEIGDSAGEGKGKGKGKGKASDA